MAENYIIAQSQPAAGIRTDIYTVPAGKRSVGVTVNACTDMDDTFGISVAPTGAAYSTVQNLVPDTTPITGPNVYQTTSGWTLPAGTIIRVISAGGNVSFTIFGDEIT